MSKKDKPKPEITLIPEEEKTYQIYREQGYSVSKTCEVLKCSDSKLYRWKKKYNWDARRLLDEFGDKALQEVVHWLIDPETTVADIDTSNVLEAKQCLALSLAKIKQALMDENNEDRPREVERLQKLSSALEKIVSTQIKEKTGGVHHFEGKIAKFDMAELTRIRLEHHRLTGEWLSEKQIMEFANPDNLKNVK